MRTRIALATALAVIIAIPTLILAFFDATPNISAAAARYEAVTLHHGASSHGGSRANSQVMTYAQARNLSKMVAYANAVQAQKQAAYIAAVAAQQAAAQAAAANSFDAIPAAWKATAICEEGGRNDPYAGFFGILEWNGFGGYPTAGSAPLAVQLQWEARYIGSPPDAPGQCHSY